jgi:hypothetical protein
LAIATRHVLGVMPKISVARAQSLVESMLGQLQGVGATGEKAITETCLPVQ